MKRFRDLSISFKLTLLAVVTSLLVLLGTIVGFSVVDYRLVEAEMIENYSTTAEVFGKKCLKALDFSDANEASVILSWLHLDQQVTMAGLYNAENQVFASFQRDVGETPPFEKIRHLNGVFGRDGYFHLVRPVIDEGEVVGHMYLRVNCDKLWFRLKSQIHLAVLFVLISVIVSIALARSLQQVISGPILELAETARHVIQSGDYSLRAKKSSEDEIGELVAAFNQMLTMIGVRSTELVKRTDEAMAASVAKSQFLANMSHEIRTPLNAIMGYADLLRREWAVSPEEREEMLTTVHSSGRHLMQIINDILDLSKIESGHVELDLRLESPHSILSEVVSLMRVPFIEKNLTLEYNWEGPVPAKIKTDGKRLRQILINLLGNARKFTPTGGVRLIARVEGELSSARLVIDVIDTGVGISLEKQNQIFEPFVQADSSVTRRFGGTGLGLSISRRLARLMGGDLTVTSSPGAGSDFCLSITAGDLTNTVLAPLNAIGDVIPGKSSRDLTSNEIPMLNGLRVLLVDDGDSNRRLISLVLKRAGVEIMEASNGKQACDIALGENTFDIILLDMQMPIMDGYTAAKTMRQAGLNTPIIALTAHAMKEDRDKCLNAGCSDYLTKPVNADELLARLNSVKANKPSSSSVEVTVHSEPIRSQLPVDDPEFATIVIDFILELRREVARLAVAVQNRDAAETLKISHWIKGSAGTVGFGCFTAQYLQITTALRSNMWSDVDRLLITIQDYVDRIEVPELIFCET